MTTIEHSRTTQVEWTDESMSLTESRSPDDVEATGDDVHRIAHVSDFHLGKPVDGPGVPERLERWFDTFEDLGVRDVVVSGDLVEEPGDRASLLRIRHLLEAGDFRWHVVPGNHDVVAPGRPGPFHSIYGSYPRVVGGGPVEWILCDTLSGLPVDERTPYERLEARDTGAYYRGRVGAEQLAEAERQLEARRPRGRWRILVLHHHLAPEREILDEVPESGAPDRLMCPVLDAEAVVDWASEKGVHLVFHGHKHEYWPLYRRRDSLLVCNTGSATRGRPEAPARILDLADSGDALRVWKLQALFR